MTSLEARWELVNSIAGMFILPAILIFLLGIFRIQISVIIGRLTFRVRFRVSWTYLIYVFVDTLRFISLVSLGKTKEAVICGIFLAFWGFMYRFWKDREDKDDDDEDGTRQKTAKQVGEKSRARIKKLVDSLNPMPGPRPAPIPN